MYEKILVTTDGSEEALKAVEHASQIAEKFDAEVHVLNVIDVNVTNAKEYAEAFTGEVEEHAEQAANKMEEKFQEKGLEPVGHVKRGIPYARIVEFAEKQDMDLIVMASRGRTGLEKFAVGSTTEKVVRKSSVPVLTIGRD